MKKENLNTLIIILVTVTISVIVFGLFYYMYDRHDSECLNKIGEEYCLENNYTEYRDRHDYAGIDFLCIGEGNERIGETGYEGFYFIEEELDSCLTKEANSFKKLDRKEGLDK